MRSLLLFSTLTTALITGCSQQIPPNTDNTASTTPQLTAADAVSYDENSYAEPQKVQITNLALDSQLDFDNKQLAANVTYTLEWKDKTATELTLDTRDLTIEQIQASDTPGNWAPLSFALATADPAFGSKLTIQAPAQPAQIRITYKTSPQASGLQWLEPSMTEGGQLPFMFSQSQAIHARSWIPIQDTPSVRFTYSAHITTRPDVMVLMGAANDPQTVRDGDYNFEMRQPIPSYLFAIAAGDLEFKAISDRSGVWAEPSMVEKAAAEFADTEKMIQVAENLYGPYRWERYDLLVLPPSFPFGGMENPGLTFATPTVIVGDKSLVSLIAHELAHSWSGNLVTNASWKDIWLNEGFTTYVQGRITEAVYGQEVAEMERQIDQTDLAGDMQTIAAEDQKLGLAPLTGRDPDEALTSVPYIKGAWFLQFLEQRFGREKFDAFLRNWFDSHAFQSVNNDLFVAYLQQHLLATSPGLVTEAELDAWLNQPGIPEAAPRANSRNFSMANTARLGWQGSGKLPPKEVTDAWGTLEWVYFIDGMGETISAEQLQQLDQAYQLTGTPNGEIAMRWYSLAIRSGAPQVWPAAGEFIQHVGRRKLVLPIYSELVKTPEGLQFATETLAKAKPGYHPLTTESVQALITQATPK